MQNQALYMLQLWADTFMMYQDTYPGFQKYYRELKVEGVKFPERIKNEETIMGNLEGISSPMYDFVIQAEKNRNEETPTKKSITSTGRQSNATRGSKVSKGRKSSIKEVKQELFEEEDKIDMDPELEIAEINMKLQELEDNQDYVEEEGKFSEEIDSASYKKYQKENFDKAIFELSKSHFDRLDDMLENCESYTDMVTSVIIQMFEEALKGKLKCEKVLQVRKVHKLEGSDDKDARESLTHMNLKINDFKEKYYLLKDRQIREYNKAKRRVEKKQKKIQKEADRLEKRKKRKEEKLAKLKKQEEAANPFDVTNEEEGPIGHHPLETTLMSDSATESSHSDSSESEKSNEDSDEDGLHAPKSMHEIRIQEAERKRMKNNKKRDKELKKIIREKEKKRTSKISNNAPGGGYFRNSVLVQKTLNFFGRKSKPSTLVKESDEEDNEAEKLENNEQKSDNTPKLNDYFVQTSSEVTKSKTDNKENFEKISKEVEPEYFKNEDVPENDEEDGSSQESDTSRGKENESEDEKEKDDNKQIFNYQEKPPIGIPPLGKNKSHMNKQANVKKIMAPPKAAMNRHSVLQKTDLLDLLEN